MLLHQNCNAILHMRSANHQIGAFKHSTSDCETTGEFWSALSGYDFEVGHMVKREPAAGLISGYGRHTRADHHADLPMPKLKVALYNDVEVEVLSTSSCYG